MLQIAYCGLNCAECPAYNATQSDDQTLREKVAAEWSKEFNIELSSDDINCDGCHSTEGVLFSHCFECPMRLCALDRPLETCAECDEYPCKDLEEFFGWVPVAKMKLESLRSTPRR